MLRRVVLLFPFLLAALPLPAEGARVRHLNLEEMTARAGRILHGRCVDVDIHLDPDLNQVVTDVTLQVIRRTKGEDAGRIRFRLLGDQRMEASADGSLPGIPAFRRGEEVVVLLYPESGRGLTSPVGLGQGRFSVSTDKRGRRIAVNGYANEGLFERLSPRARERVERRLAGKPAAPELDLDLLLDLTVDLGGEVAP